MSDRSPVVDVSTTCHILTVLGHTADNINDESKSRIIGECLSDIIMCK